MRALVASLALGLAPALALAPSSAEANPLDMFGSGARAAAMAGASTASARDGSAVYYNPALLPDLPGLEVDLGYRYVRPELRLNSGNLEVDSSRGSRIAFGLPGQIGAVKMGMGVSVFLPDQHLIRVRSLSQEQPRFSLYDNRPQRLSLIVSFGAQLAERFSIGGGLGYVTATIGTVGLDGRVGFPMAEDSELALDLDVDIRSLAYPIAGLRFDATPWLTLAASYRGGVQPTTDLEFTISGDVGSANRDPIVEDASIYLRTLSLSHFQPGQFTLGMEARMSPRLLITSDVSLHRWSAYENPSAQLTTELELGEFNDLITPPAEKLLIPANFHDILIPRLGLEYLAYGSNTTAVHARAGYSFEPSPAPEQIGLTNFVDNDKHTGSAGIGLTLREWSQVILQPLSIDASFALAHLPERSHKKLSPVDPVGDYRSSGQVWQFFTTSRIRF